MAWCSVKGDGTGRAREFAEPRLCGASSKPPRAEDAGLPYRTLINQCLRTARRSRAVWISGGAGDRRARHNKDLQLTAANGRGGS